MKYHISEEALQDIRKIWSYTVETWSEEQAERYFNLIIDEIEYLCTAPEDGKSMEHIKPGYRCSKVKLHLIFYKIEGDILKVIRILHQMMDIESRLK